MDRRHRSWWDAIADGARSFGRAVTAADFNFLHVVATCGITAVAVFVLARAT